MPFLLLASNLVCVLCLVSWGIKLGFWSFLMQATNFIIALISLYPVSFDILFSFSQDICWFLLRFLLWPICCFIRVVLLSFFVFMDFLVAFCYWFLVSIHCDWLEKILCVISVFQSVKICFVASHVVCPRKECVVGGRSVPWCVLGPVICGLFRLLFLYWSFVWLFRLWSKVWVAVSNYFCTVVFSTFNPAMYLPHLFGRLMFGAWVFIIIVSSWLIDLFGVV